MINTGYPSILGIHQQSIQGKQFSAHMFKFRNDTRETYFLNWPLNQNT